MKIVTRHARMRHAAGGTVTIRARIFHRDNDVSGLGALRCVVAVGAGHRGMFAMIKFAMHEPAFGDDRFCHFGLARRVCFDFVTVGATGVNRGRRALNRADSALRRERGVAEKNAFLKFFPGRNLFKKTPHLLSRDAILLGGI